MFLHHARSPLLVVQEKCLIVVQENCKKFNVRQTIGASIWPGGIHLAVNQILRVTMSLCHTRSPLHAVQKTLRHLMLDKHLKHPRGWEPDCESCHVSMSCKVTLPVVQEKPLYVVEEKLKKFKFGQAFGTSIWLGILGIHLAGN